MPSLWGTGSKGKTKISIHIPLKIPFRGTSLVVKQLRLCAPGAGGLGSISGQGTRSHLPQWKSKIPLATTETWPSQKKKPKINNFKNRQLFKAMMVCPSYNHWGAIQKWSRPTSTSRETPERQVLGGKAHWQDNTQMSIHLCESKRNRETRLSLRVNACYINVSPKTLSPKINSSWWQGENEMRRFSQYISVYINTTRLQAFLI